MKVAFADFWWKFDEEKNFFIDSMRNITSDVIITKNIQEADLVFFSCFGNDHATIDRSRTKKIYFTGENMRPPVEECDYSLSFDYESHDGKNFRLPLWMLQIDWWKTGGYSYTNPQFVVPLDQLESNQYRDTQKDNFCCTIFNRDHTGLRVSTLEALSAYKPVSCFGEPWGNWFYGEDKKIEVLSCHKFTLCYENSSHPGYFTEKPLHARVAGSIPIYWSDPAYISDFNAKGFIQLCDFANINGLIERVIEVDASESIRKQMMEEPIFSIVPKIDPYIEFMKNATRDIK